MQAAAGADAGAGSAAVTGSAAGVESEAVVAGLSPREVPLVNPPRDSSPGRPLVREPRPPALAPPRPARAPRPPAPPRPANGFEPPAPPRPAKGFEPPDPRDGKPAGSPEPETGQYFKYRKREFRSYLLESWGSLASLA